VAFVNRTVAHMGPVLGRYGYLSGDGQPGNPAAQDTTNSGWIQSITEKVQGKFEKVGNNLKAFGDKTLNSIIEMGNLRWVL